LGVELPKEIVNRPKRGFTLPFERWLRGEMRPVVEDALLKSNWDQTSISVSAVSEVWTRFLAGETSWSRPWSLFVLQRWCEQNLNGGTGVSPIQPGRDARLFINTTNFPS
jgi:asparagine synthase (glutamine-hydrolysing)